MGRILVLYWSGTGNTQKMAELIADGAKEKGGDVECKSLSGFAVDTALSYDALAVGCPSMGQEVLEEGEVEPFVEELCGKAGGRKIAIFGSYGWGDGEWMRNWADRMRGCGATLFDDGLIVHETPEGESADACREFGAKLATF